MHMYTPPRYPVGWGSWAPLSRWGNNWTGTKVFLNQSPSRHGPWPRQNTWAESIPQHLQQPVQSHGSSQNTCFPSLPNLLQPSQDHSPRHLPKTSSFLLLAFAWVCVLLFAWLVPSQPWSTDSSLLPGKASPNSLLQGLLLLFSEALVSFRAATQCKNIFLLLHWNCLLTSSLSNKRMANCFLKVKCLKPQAKKCRLWVGKETALCRTTEKQSIIEEDSTSQLSKNWNLDELLPIILVIMMVATGKN